MWNHTEVTRQLKIQYPIIQAPMAGSTTPELVSAVSNGGGLGSIGAGYYSPEKLAEDIRNTKAITDQPFSVNLFVPEYNEVTSTQIDRMKEILTPYYEEFNIEPDMPTIDKDDTFDQLVQIIIDENIKICSFTFGIPDPVTVKKLKKAGVTLIGCATTVDEAILNEQAGMDMVVAQGFEAGGHRGSFVQTALRSSVGTMSLVPQIKDKVTIPVIAAGGIMDGRGLYAGLKLGADAAQMGTAFLTTKESAAPKIHKEAILNSTEADTVLTRSFSGKYARGIRNRFIDEMDWHQEDILPYPFQNQMTKKIRSKAAAEGKSDILHLWSGQSVRLSRDVEAGELLMDIVNQVNKILRNENYHK
ncbi:NAD(P)H-dependent flavin oxidoreductase [Lacicoccus qingdaonensis]|uniref:Probable nitronate monooxygenase n=1 Tax=Lacicoccus qingdaonensis TaxID=576118 RepID=A0A1G9GMS2_9BACL|nr:nitronate monooxygenase family protein [Salinicoccus qingdaonensis]SDL01989.1 nitronate monooxygenase [Salinicoccus qingdaonensis]